MHTHLAHTVQCVLPAQAACQSLFFPSSIPFPCPASRSVLRGRICLPCRVPQTLTSLRSA